MSGLCGVMALAACALAPGALSSGPTNVAAADGKASAGRIKKLVADGIWQINAPTPYFDASGLLWHNGKLLVLGDKSPALYEILLKEDDAAAGLELRLFPAPFAKAALGQRVDCEGLALDESGRMYLVNERSRTFFRSTPDLATAEELTVNLESVSRHFSKSSNAAFEGIAVGGGSIYLANEREQERIVVVDAATLRVTNDFVARPISHHLFWHYSDLSWHDGKLYVLLRHARRILEVDPKSGETLLEYDFSAIEKRRDVEYQTPFGTGAMEGLGVTAEAFWLVTDNNGQARKRYPKDKRPTLIRCPR